jgi:hypothetical protein
MSPRINRRAETRPTKPKPSKPAAIEITVDLPVASAGGASPVVTDEVTPSGVRIRRHTTLDSVLDHLHVSHTGGLVW